MTKAFPLVRSTGFVTPLLAAALALANPVSAQTLTVALATAPTSIDPLFQNLGSNHELAIHTFDTLLQMSPTMQLRPGLAESWGLTSDPLVWEFKLRKGVKFHDGTPFTAQDVVFSFRRAMNVPGAPSTYSRSLVGVDVEKLRAVDDHTLQIVTKNVLPLLPRFVSSIPIVSRAIGADALPREFNDGNKTIGTGPYKFERYVPGDKVSYVANTSYWGGKPHWERVVYRIVTSGPTRVAALLAGDVDAIAAVPTTDVAGLERNPKVAVACGPSTRVVYWTMDVASDQAKHITTKDGKPMPNPLRDVRVRRAITMAVDRSAIVEKVMSGLAIATNQFTSAGFDGYNPAIALPENDIGRARRLMAEADVPNGFRMTLHATNDRYVNDAQQAQAVAQMLARIGIDVTVETMPVANYFNRARAKDFTFAMVAFSMGTGETSSILTPALLSDSINNYGSWKNAKFDSTFKQAMSTVNLAEHRRLIQEATALAMADVPIVPTHMQVVCWASRAALKITAFADEYTRADSFKRQ